MTLARLHGGPLDGQVLPLDDSSQDTIIVPYSETQIVYRKQGVAEHTGQGEGPAEQPYWYVEAEGDLTSNDND